MTRKEAIAYWKKARKDTAGEKREAINMAISALSAERVGEWDDVLEIIINIESELFNLKELCGARMEVE